MPIDLRKLLPRGNLGTVQRYRDIINVFQSFLYNDLKNQIDALKNKDYIDLASTEDIQNTLYDFGFNLFQGNGYTATSEYLKRQLRTIVKRIQHKGTEISYQYLLYIYKLLGDVYPLLLKPDMSLEPWLTWFTDPDGEAPSDALDTGLFLDMPVPNILDSGFITNSITRHILLSYVSDFVENTTEFMSTDTATALLNDVGQNKREVEIPHFEARLYAQANLAGGEVDKNFTAYNDPTIFATQKSILVNPAKNFTNAVTIQFGSGTQPVIGPAITGVQQLIASYPLSSFKIKLQDNQHLYFKNVLFPTTKWFDYKEIAVLDMGGNCFFYTTHPWIRYDQNMLSSGYWFFSTI